MIIIAHTALLLNQQNHVLELLNQLVEAKLKLALFSAVSLGTTYTSDLPFSKYRSPIQLYFVLRFFLTQAITYHSC